jgi:hypothetical protein
VIAFLESTKVVQLTSHYVASSAEKRHVVGKEFEFLLLCAEDALEIAVLNVLLLDGLNLRIMTS